MPRIQSLDLARGFTVFIMPAVHTMMLYSTAPVQQSAIGVMFQFLAEGPGAQLFMLLMGTSFVLSSKTNTSSETNTSSKTNAVSPSNIHFMYGIPFSMIKRTGYLIIAAYVLNFCKLVVPVALGFMPANLLNEFHFNNMQEAAIFFFLMGDILHFAALAFPILYIIDSLIKFFIAYSKKGEMKYGITPDEKMYNISLMLLPIMICMPIIFLSPMLWDLKTNNGLLNYFFALIGGHPPQVYFPLFPWLVYPIAGLSIGYAIAITGVDKTMKQILWMGTVFLFISLLLPATFPTSKEETGFSEFYRTKPADTIFHLGFILVWLAAFHFISGFIKNNWFFQLLSFCSKNITLIYFTQWILVFWCMAFTGYHELNMPLSIIWMIIQTTISFLIPYTIQLSKVSSKKGK